MVLTELLLLLRCFSICGQGMKGGMNEVRAGGGLHRSSWRAPFLVTDILDIWSLPRCGVKRKGFGYRVLSWFVMRVSMFLMSCRNLLGNPSLCAFSRGSLGFQAICFQHAIVV